MKKQLKKWMLLFVVTMLVIISPVGVLAAKKPTPGATTLTKVSSSAYNKVTINWKKTSGATDYKIYYRKSGTKKWIGIKTVSSKSASYTHTASKSKPIVVGQKYEYTVRGYNSKYKTYGKYNTKGLKVQTKPSTIKLKSAKLNGSKDAVTVSWNGSKSGDSYKVYRKTGNSGWKCIATTKSTKYTDKKPVAGTKNYYTVRAYFSKTKALGGYNKKGVSVTVPRKDSGSGNNSKPDKYVKVERVELSESGIIEMKPGESIILTANVYPSNATDKDIKWEIFGEEIVDMHASGHTAKITATEYGKTDIKIYALGKCEYGDAMANVTINVEPDPEVYARQVLEETNKVRAKHGCAPLVMHPNMQKAAIARAKELSVNFSHRRPNGTSGITIGQEYNVAGIFTENIAMGQGSPKEVVSDWESSSGHLIAMLSGDAKTLGVGYYKGDDGVTYWCQLFAGDGIDRTATLTFDANGGEGGCTVNKMMGFTVYLETIEKHPIYGIRIEKTDFVPTVTREGYRFTGWMNEYGNYIRSTSVMNNTVYARWEKI